MIDNKDEIFLDEYGEVEQKLIIMYLIDAAGIPLLYNEISDFILEVGYMDYVTLITCLADMEETNYLTKTLEGTTNRYAVTKIGIEALELFGERIPDAVKYRINQYISENKHNIKNDYEVFATISEKVLNDGSTDYIVKCGAYDNDAMLMELNVSVVSKDLAKLVLNNWKNNMATIYKTIFEEITK